MARTAAERRAARKRKGQNRNRRPAEGPPAGEKQSVHQRRVRELVVTGAWHADGEHRDRIIRELVALEPDVDPDGHVTELLTGLVAALWEHGWQPADLAHVVRRRWPQRVGRLMAALIAGEARLSGAAARAPEEWVAQLSALGPAPGPDCAGLASWWGAEGLTAAQAWDDVLGLVAQLGDLGELQQLLPPPSRWPRRAEHRPVRTPGHSADARMLSRIRALLAKAESTDFPEEAEALSAKAQDLMTRHAVDAAVLDAEHGTSVTSQVGARRVHIDNPYPEAKVQLLNAVAGANGVRVIWLEPLGIATMVGLPMDLDLVDLLFTSLLVQATRAMSDAGRAGTRRTRSPSFRRAFLLSFGLRIGERLAEVRDQVTQEATASRGASLVPVLRARTQAVDDVFARLFPETVQIATRAVDARGWHAGRLAAETADLGSGRDQVSR